MLLRDDDRADGRHVARVLDGPDCRDVVTGQVRPIWWRVGSEVPPTTWLDMFEAFTGEATADEWGLAAGIFVSRTRRRTGRGPTFSELFQELLPDGHGLPSRLTDLTFAERSQVVQEFRLHVMIEWRRRGWVNWDHGVERSLRTGRAFRQRSRQRGENVVTALAHKAGSVCQHREASP